MAATFLIRALAWPLLVLAGSLTLRAQELAVEAAQFPGLHVGSRVSAIAEGRDGRLWFAFGDRLQVIDGSLVSDVMLEPHVDGSAASGVRCLHAARDGRLWIGTHRGLWSVDPAATSGRAVRQLAEANVLSMCCDPDGALYVRVADALDVLLPDGTTQRVAVPSGKPSVVGLCATADAVWAWDRTTLYRITRRGRELNFEAKLELAHSESMVAAASGTALVVLHDGRIHLLDAGASSVLLAHTGDLGAIRFAAVAPDAVWLGGPDRLWRVARAGGAVTPCSIYLRGAEVGTEIHAMHCDEQGLLWIGSQLDVVRATFPRGIDNVVLQDLESNESIAAFAELSDGTMLLGSTHGRLLRQRGSGWQLLQTPWPAGSTSSRRGIEAIHVERDALWAVATAAHGVWLWDSTDWVQLQVELGDDACRALCGSGDGTVWLASDRSVYVRRTASCSFDEVPLPESQRGLGAGPCTLTCEPGGEVWLSTYRAGLLRFDRHHGSFVPHGTDAQDRAITNLVTEASAKVLFGTTAEGLWSIDRTSGERRLAHPTARSAGFRAAAHAKGSSIWLTTSNQLAHFDIGTGRTRYLSPRQGAHPLGYHWRTAHSRPDGEVWFGAVRGFTRIDSRAHAEIHQKPRLVGIEIQIAGQYLADAKVSGHWEVPAGASSLTVMPRFVEHSRDVPPRFTVVAVGGDGAEPRRSPTGSLTDLRPGSYDLLAEVLVDSETGSTMAFELGRVTVLDPPFGVAWLLPLSIAVLAGLSSLWFWSRLPKRALPRRITIDRLLHLADRPAEQTLDVAFLAVAAGEECARLTSVPHASVWMSPVTQGPRILLAEFGQRIDAAAQLVNDAIEQGTRLRDLGFIRQHGDHIDLLLCMRGAGSLEFKVLLHRLPAASEPPVERLAEAISPVLAGLRKQAWLERIEADFAHQSARLSAGMHDLRGSLTALRIGAFSLSKQPADAELPDAARRLADAAEHVLSRVESLLQGIERASSVQLQPCDPAELARQAVQGLASRAAAKGLVLEISGPTLVNGLELDPSWFSRALDNVIGNAIKFSPPGATVRVVVEASEETFQLHVDDDGPGFRDWEREAVFLPGVTGSAQPTGGESQSGLGLWVARQAIRAMGGRLWVAASTGRGARISLSLPRSVTPIESTGPAD